jgi:peptidoglycan hydrolase-like protein with peptidoglycan-binding domain
MKSATQAAVAALAAALLAMPALAQSQFNQPPAQQRQGPLPPTGSPSDYQAPAQQRMPSAAQTTPTRSTAKKSISSQSVRDLQAALNSKDNANLNVDGIMGPKTRAALKKYQTANNLKTEAEARARLGISSSATATAPARSSTPSASGSRAIEPAKPNNSGSAPSRM